jgi:hypothetical protein
MCDNLLSMQATGESASGGVNKDDYVISVAVDI